jgi:putative spermidine/putrescine transport system permease protein
MLAVAVAVPDVPPLGPCLDTVVVTRFTAGTDSTLPIWIYSQLFRATQRPIVNVAALIVIVISIVPVYLAQRLGSDTTGVTSR